jgi:membrane-associated phospholipid phosphatase
MADFYEFDTNTNVFPSMHVTGALAVHFALWHDEKFGKPVWRVIFTIITASICASTVFLKQHSILDVFPALAISFVSYYLIYKKKLFDKFLSE